MFDENVIRNWSDLGNRMTDVIFQLYNSKVLSNDEKTKTGRWTIQDPRSFAKLGAEQLYEQMSVLYDSADKLITNSKKSITNQLNQLSWDFENGIDTDWQPDGSQDDDDPCGPTPGYPTTANACTANTWVDGKACVWNADTSKCGGGLMTFAVFREELEDGQNYRSRKLLDDIESKLNVNKLSIAQMYQDLKTTSLIGMLKTSQLVSEKTFDATNAAIRLVRYVIGTYVGFGVVSKLLPFSLSIVLGVKKGVKGFGKITSNSKAFDIPADSLSLKRFNALLLFVSGLVVAVPIVTIAIFFYQAYADQYFVMVVVAMEIWAVGQAFKGFMTNRQNILVLVVSGSLGVTGFICWVVFDENAMFIAEYIVDNAPGLSFLKIITVIVNAGFNYFFSRIITLQLIAKLSANVFAHGASGTMIYEETDADGMSCFFSFFCMSSLGLIFIFISTLQTLLCHCLFICVGTVRRIPSNLAALGIFNLEDREELMQQQMETETGVEMKAVEEIQGTLQHSQLVGVQ